jgi:hypothetical protein
MRRERRQNHRVSSQQKVSLLVPHHGDQAFTAIAQNLSIEGAFLICDRHITPGSRMDLSLVLPPEVTRGEEKRVYCVTEVVRVQELMTDGSFGAAVSFQEYRLP